MYDFQSVCLPKGCYEASLVLNPNSAKLSRAASIPKCNVFLAPLHPKQLFCVEESVQTEEIISFGDKPCYSVCDRQPHINFNAILGEEQGSGWMGGYYTITPLLPTFKRSDPLNIKMSNINGISAGTLEWNFEENRSICVPVQDYKIPSSVNKVVYSKNTTIHTNNKSRQLTTIESKYKKNNEISEIMQQIRKQDSGKSFGPTCFSIQLSIPYNELLPIFPILYFVDAWMIPHGQNYFAGTYDSLVFYENILQNILRKEFGMILY